MLTPTPCPMDKRCQKRLRLLAWTGRSLTRRFTEPKMHPDLGRHVRSGHIANVKAVEIDNQLHNLDICLHIYDYIYIYIYMYRYIHIIYIYRYIVFWIYTTYGIDLYKMTGAEDISTANPPGDGGPWHFVALGLGRNLAASARQGNWKGNWKSEIPHNFQSNIHKWLTFVSDDNGYFFQSWYQYVSMMIDLNQNHDLIFCFQWQNLIACTFSLRMNHI